jgi:hypothetical protein
MSETFDTVSLNKVAESVRNACLSSDDCRYSLPGRKSSTCHRRQVCPPHRPYESPNQTFNSPNGIDFHTALQLAARGATVYCGARSLTKAEDGIKEMRKKDLSIRADQLRPLFADLGDLKAVKAAAEEWMKETGRLDVLVNNAGL